MALKVVKASQQATMKAVLKIQGPYYAISIAIGTWEKQNCHTNSVLMYKECMQCTYKEWSVALIRYTWRKRHLVQLQNENSFTQNKIFYSLESIQFCSSLNKAQENCVVMLGQVSYVEKKHVKWSQLPQPLPTWCVQKLVYLFSLFQFL